MTADRSRRMILKSFLGAATVPAITSFAYIAQGIDPGMAQGASSPMTAADIVSAIRDKKMSAVAVVQAALARAEQVKHLNALITLNRDGALAAARKVDAAV